MTDPILGEAHRVFACAYQRRHPQANFQQAVKAFDKLPTEEREWLLNTAGKVMAAWPPHPPIDPIADADLRRGCTCSIPWSFRPGCPACAEVAGRLTAVEATR